MSYDQNPYYNPEKLGLTVVAEIDYSSGSYEFDMRVVWRHDETGVLYTQRDEGCSCPTPFDDFDSLEKLERVDLETLRGELDYELMPQYSGDTKYITRSDAEEFLRKVEAG